MNKTELKPGIFIEGFDTSKEMVREQIGRNKELELRTTLYEGKTSEIPEELARECVRYTRPSGYEQAQYYSCKTKTYFKTAKESIQSACNNEYCIIYKTYEKEKSKQ